MVAVCRSIHFWHHDVNPEDETIIKSDFFPPFFYIFSRSLRPKGILPIRSAFESQKISKDCIEPYWFQSISGHISVLQHAGMRNARRIIAGTYLGICEPGALASRWFSVGWSTIIHCVKANLRQIRYSECVRQKKRLKPALTAFHSQGLDNMIFGLRHNKESHRGHIGQDKRWFLRYYEVLLI